MKTPAIAVFTKNRTNPAYAGARLGADRVAARLGGQTRHYVPEVPDDLEGQRALVEQCLAEPPDAAVFVPVHQTGMDPWIRRLREAGVPLVSMVSPIHAVRPVTYVHSDDHALARAVTEHVVNRLGGRGRVLLLEGIPSSATSGERQRGIASALASHPGIEVVASVRGDYQRDIACRAVAQVLAQGLRFEAVIAANDTMALGALDALEAAGLDAPLPLLAGVNAIPEAIAAIKAGRLFATVDFDAMKMACIATEAALRHLRGEAVPQDITLPVQVVDAANCAPWDLPYAERALPDWDTVMRSCA